MNPYGVPALIACVLLWTLELLGWLFRTRERVNFAFAFFCGWMGADAFVNFLLLQHYDKPYADNIVPFALVTGIGAVLSAVLFVVILTGSDRRLNEPIFGMPLKTLLGLTVAGVTLAGVLIGVQPPALIEDITFSHTGVNVDYGPYAWTMSLLLIPLPFSVWGLLFRALRTTDDAIERRFLRMNTVGLAIVILTQPLFEVLLVLFDFQAPYLSYVGGAIGAIFFFVAMIRHPLDHVEDLNRTLELKVAERTRHLREAQARLVQSEKIASLAHLVAGVAHEFNTPLGAVKSGVSTVEKGLRSLEEITADNGAPSEADRARAAKLTAGMKRSLTVVIAGLDRIASGVRRLRSFAHLDEPEIQQIDLRDGLEDAIALLPRGWEERITLVREFKDIPPVTCIPVLVNQVFFNALANAIESIPGQGEIQISTRADDAWVIFELHDTGSGIAEEHLAHIYDPGFTTKGPGVGMGLGLAIAHNVMEQHQGEIEVSSRPGEGTSLTLRFPRSLTKDEIARGPYSALSQEPSLSQAME